MYRITKGNSKLSKSWFVESGTDAIFGEPRPASWYISGRLIIRTFELNRTDERVLNSLTRSNTVLFRTIATALHEFEIHVPNTNPL